MSKLYVSAAFLVVLCGGADANLPAMQTPKQVAAEALDRLKSLAKEMPSAHRHVGRCVTVISHAQRYENRTDASHAMLPVTWEEAATKCRYLADAAQ